MPHATTQINSLISLRRGKEECQMPASLVTTQAKRPKTLRRGKEERQTPTPLVTTQARHRKTLRRGSRTCQNCGFKIFLTLKNKF